MTMLITYIIAGSLAGLWLTLLGREADRRYHPIDLSHGAVRERQRKMGLI